MASTQDVVQVEDGEIAVHEVVTSIADQTGTDVLDLPPLNESIDTDALAALLRSEATSKIEFAYDGNAVTVYADGRVDVTDEA